MHFTQYTHVCRFTRKPTLFHSSCTSRVKKTKTPKTIRQENYTTCFSKIQNWLTCTHNILMLCAWFIAKHQWSIHTNLHNAFGEPFVLDIDSNMRPYSPYTHLKKIAKCNVHRRENHIESAPVVRHTTRIASRKHPAKIHGPLCDRGNSQAPVREHHFRYPIAIISIRSTWQIGAFIIMDKCVLQNMRRAREMV